jgi:hypothetical protein
LRRSSSRAPQTRAYVAKKTNRVSKFSISVERTPVLKSCFERQLLGIAAAPKIRDEYMHWKVGTTGFSAYFETAVPVWNAVSRIPISSHASTDCSILLFAAFLPIKPQHSNSLPACLPEQIPNHGWFWEPNLVARAVP